MITNYFFLPFFETFIYGLRIEKQDVYISTPLYTNYTLYSTPSILQYYTILRVYSNNSV
jgi:hypothetical protein